MDKRIKYVAKTGYLSKGIVYVVTGILAFSAAIGLSASAEGKLGVLEFLQKQPFGNVLIILLGVGLLCYALWRFIQSIKDPENIGSDSSAIGKRIGFFFSGLIYTGLAIFSVTQLWSTSSGSGRTGGSFLSPEWMTYIFYAVAIGLALKSAFQFSKVYKGDFLEKFEMTGISEINKRKTIKWLGYSGLVSRGIVVGIMAYFFFRAADTAGGNEEIKGTAEAFQFLRSNTEGPWLIGAVALGLICYGLLMSVMAKYRRFKE